MIQVKVSISAKVLAQAGVLLSVMLLTSGIPIPGARACVDQTVRDAAFGYPRDVHLVAVVANADDAAAAQIYHNLEQWLTRSGRGLNLELRLVDVDDPEVRWDQLGIPSAPPSSPVVVLAGSGQVGRPGFLIDHWEPGPDETDLKVLKSSPARDEIRREVTRRLAILVHIPGSSREPTAAGEILSSVAETWSEREPLGVAVVRVDRSDERERLLLSFMGAAGTGPDVVGVVFGPGKMVAPLRGEEITEERLNGLLEVLVGDCTCLQSPYTLGVDLPLIWDENRDAEVVTLRSSLVTGSLSDTWGILSITVWTLGGLVLLVGLATMWIIYKRAV